MNFVTHLIINEDEIKIAPERFRVALDSSWAVVEGRI